MGRYAALGTEDYCREGSLYVSPIATRDAASSVDLPTGRCTYPGMTPRLDGMRLPTRIEKPFLDVQTLFSGASSEVDLMRSLLIR